MPATPVWIGNKDFVETPDSPRFDYDATRLTVTRYYEGPLEGAQSAQPAQGTAFQDMPAAVLVTRVSIIPKPGGIARLEVIAECQGPSQTNPAAPTYEIEWVEIDRPLLMNPRYAVGGSGAKALTSQDVAMIQKWEDEDDPDYKNKFQFKVLQALGVTSIGMTGATDTNQTVGEVPGYNIYTLSANAQDYAAKRLKGIDSYRLWCPVARQTIETFTLPNVDPCGVIEDPPSAIGAPTGYSYQRSAQRATKTGRYGKWQQQQEWQGFDTIDSDLYPSGGQG
ncbi:MAG TPA: hypothetical protein VL981_11075 [Candidatus Methylacidiphilales bacterium]|nr:hypothetical protein [Candidatus Methylacidiphilales bacterium]